MSKDHEFMLGQCEEDVDIEGVVVFILNPNGKILTTVEKLSKKETGKVAGKTSVVCETMESGETRSLAATRGILKELGISERKQNKSFFVKGYLGSMTFIDGVKANVYLYCTEITDIEKFKNNRNDKEVYVKGWDYPQNLLLDPDVRTGVREVLQKCFEAGIFELRRA